MNDPDLAFTSALDQAKLIADRKISPLELTELYLQRIEQLNPKFGAFFHIAAEQAIVDAKAKTEALVNLETLPPFYGVPTAIKDLNPVEGMPCSYGIKVAKNRMADRDDYITRRIKKAGFVILGKTATSQLGSLPYVEPNGFPPTLNPWNPNYLAGGSSGGAAVAVAAGLCAMAHGSDGAGSIRIPAACCGLVGLKPSRGRVSNAPVDELFSGCVVSGGLTRTVADAAAFLDAIEGYEVGDPFWLPSPETSFLQESQREPKTLKIGFALGIPPIGDCDDECKSVVLSTAKQLEALGHIVEPIEFGEFDGRELIEPFAIAWQTQTDVGVPGLFLDGINRQLWFKAQFYRAGKYIKARQNLYRFGRKVVEVCHPYDVILLPTLMRPALKVGEFDRLGYQKLLDSLVNWFAPCPLFNASGQPAIALPCGISSQGIPLSIQLVGCPADEVTILQLATQLATQLAFLHHVSTSYRDDSLSL
jgi:amidase